MKLRVRTASLWLVLLACSAGCLRWGYSERDRDRGRDAGQDAGGPAVDPEAAASAEAATRAREVMPRMAAGKRVSLAAAGAGA